MLAVLQTWMEQICNLSVLNSEIMPESLESSHVKKVFGYKSWQPVSVSVF